MEQRGSEVTVFEGGWESDRAPEARASKIPVYQTREEIMIAVKSLLAAAVTLVTIAFVMTTPGLGQSSRGGHGGGLSATRGGLRIPVPGRNPVKGATVIPNRGGGFTMYGPQGASRYLGKPQGNKVFHPDGSSSIVIPSAEGGATVYGPQGTHKVFPDGDKSDAEESKTP